VNPYNVLTPTRHGLMVCNRNDAYVGKSLLAYGEFSEPEVAMLGRYITPGAVVLDVGANIGALTLPFARLVGPRGIVVAFEPQRLVYQTLCANLALNSVTNVLAYQYAVGKPGVDATRVQLTDPYAVENFGGVTTGPDAKGETVVQVALDDMALPPAALVKVDVEGMEADVLEGARTYLTTHRPVLYVEADRGDKRLPLIALLEELGYDVFPHDPPLYSPANFRGDPTNIFGGIVSLNLLALPRGGKHHPPEMPA